MSKPAAIHFEAKLYALRKSKDGLVLSFVVHPSDIPKEIITADIGEQYIVACAPYVEKTGLDRESPAPEPAVTTAPGGQAGVSKPKTEGERVLQRCAILCNEPRFQEWVALHPLHVPGHSAADFVRSRCGITSRSQIAADPAIRQRWLNLEAKYLMDTGQFAEVRG